MNGVVLHNWHNDNHSAFAGQLILNLAFIIKLILIISIGGANVFRGVKAVVIVNDYAGHLV